MEFGVQFFPAVGPDQKGADHYWREALELTQLAEQLGFTNVRTVEHYFLSYGGYSPDPLIFLSAAAAVTRSLRLVTGAVLPVFNHPLKLAGQIGMVDARKGDVLLYTDPVLVGDPTTAVDRLRKALEKGFKKLPDVKAQ